MLLELLKRHSSSLRPRRLPKAVPPNNPPRELLKLSSLPRLKVPKRLLLLKICSPPLP